jgi:hypothetical protein
MITNLPYSLPGNTRQTAVRIHNKGAPAISDQRRRKRLRDPGFVGDERIVHDSVLWCCKFGTSTRSEVTSPASKTILGMRL